MEKHGPIIIVFGITGDLSKRKLLPALYHLLRQDLLPADTKIIGISRRPLSAKKLIATVELCVLENDKVCDPEGIAKVSNALETLQLDPENAADYQALKHLIAQLEGDTPRERLFYMSIPTSSYAPIIKNLATHGLNDTQSRLLLEKPFGHDLRSAEALIKLLGKGFREEQIYRIDHYLAKETAQNLLAFRSHNPIFASLWNAEHIQKVHVRALEKIGIEGRSGFYEQTGALRDLIQSHLMQLLAITLMDIPTGLDNQGIHASKQHFLEQLLPADPEQAIRGQYEAYRHEVENPESTTETYALVHLRHQSERWRGTDIVLETGKALAEKQTDVTIEFKSPHAQRRNDLTFRLQPNEGIALSLMVKEPGLENRMRREKLDFRYEDSFAGMQHIDAYERVLMDAVRGDQALFASDREVLSTWRVLQPVIDAWQHSSNDLHFYPVGASENDLVHH